MTTKQGRPSAEPIHVAVSRSKGIRIDWADGHSSDYPLQHLRDRCPCAACAEARPSDNPFPMYKPALQIVSAAPAGSYAVRVEWNDGHTTGLYPYEYLRRICPCPKCRE